MSREDADAPSLEVFKAELDGALSNLVCPCQGDEMRRSLRSLPNQDILSFYDSVIWTKMANSVQDTCDLFLMHFCHFYFKPGEIPPRDTFHKCIFAVPPNTELHIVRLKAQLLGIAEIP